MAFPEPLNPYQIKNWDNTAYIRDARELFRGRSATADLTGPPTYIRVWLVRTKFANTPHHEIAKAVQCPLRSPYPDDPDAFVVDINVAQEGDSAFHYKVTLTYKFLDESEVIPWFRPSQFSFSGSLTSAPAFWYYTNAGDNQSKTIIHNTAGDPLGGLSRDEGEFSVSVQYNQKPPFDYARAQQYVGAINSDTWSGGAPKTWKCQSIQATRKFEMVPNLINPSLPPTKTFYFETSIQIAYKGTGWDLQTWDVGFNEIVGGSWDSSVMARIGGTRQAIKDSNLERVSEPAALSYGVAKAPGIAPDMLTFRIYPTMPFMGVFEQIPTLVPSGYPYNYIP